VATSVVPVEIQYGLIPDLEKQLERHLHENREPRAANTLLREEVTDEDIATRRGRTGPAFPSRACKKASARSS